MFFDRGWEKCFGNLQQVTNVIPSKTVKIDILVNKKYIFVKMAYKCGQEVFCDPKPFSYVVSAIVHSPASFLDLKGEKLRILRIGIKAGCVVFAKYRNFSVSPWRNQTVDSITRSGDLSPNRRFMRPEKCQKSPILAIWRFFSNSLPHKNAIKRGWWR